MTVLQSMLLPRPNARIQRDLSERDIQLGADGSIIRDGDRIYAPSSPLGQRNQTVEYFHGIFNGCPVCTTEHSDYSASEMISCDRGFVARRITHLQTRFRRIRQNTLTQHMVQTGILLSLRSLNTTRWRQFRCPSRHVNWWWHQDFGFFYVDDSEWERYTNPDDMECWWWHPKTARWFWESIGTGRM